MNFFKSIYSVTVMFITLYSLISLTSCTDDTVSSNPEPEGFDSARFTWTADTLYLYTYNILVSLYAADTNNIFFVNLVPNKIFWLKDHVFTEFNFPNEYYGEINGKGLSECYLFGTTIVGNQCYVIVRKFNGASFEKYLTYPIPRSSGISSSIYVNSNEIWLTGGNGFIFKFDGNTISKVYNVSDSVDFQWMILNNNNKINAYGINFLGFSNNWISYIYEFDDNNCNLIFRDSLSNNINFMPLKNEIAGCNRKGIYSFDGKTFTKIINSANTLDIFSFTGESKNEIMVRGICYEPGILFNWNGKKWSKEIVAYKEDYSCINYINNNFFIFGLSYLYNYKTIIFRGQRKL